LYLVAGIPGQVISPDRFGEHPYGHRVASVEKQNGEQDPISVCRDRDHSSTDMHLHRAEYPSAQDHPCGTTHQAMAR
jgi:hypothetical protein